MARDAAAVAAAVAAAAALASSPGAESRGAELLQGHARDALSAVQFHERGLAHDAARRGGRGRARRLGGRVGGRVGGLSERVVGDAGGARERVVGGQRAVALEAPRAS